MLLAFTTKKSIQWEGIEKCTYRSNKKQNILKLMFRWRCWYWMGSVNNLCSQRMKIAHNNYLKFSLNILRRTLWEVDDRRSTSLCYIFVVNAIKPRHCDLDYEGMDIAGCSIKHTLKCYLVISSYSVNVFLLFCNQNSRFLFRKMERIFNSYSIFSFWCSLL